MRVPRELDAVELLQDLPEHGLCKGEKGTVIAVLRHPTPLYLVEFADDDGVEIVSPALSAEQIKVVWSLGE